LTTPSLKNKLLHTHLPHYLEHDGTTVIPQSGFNKTFSGIFDEQRGRLNGVFSVFALICKFDAMEMAGPLILSAKGGESHFLPCLHEKPSQVQFTVQVHAAQKPDLERKRDILS